MSEAHLERDIVLKLGHQSQCFRICEYHKLRNELHMFEEGFGHTVPLLTLTVKVATCALLVWASSFLKPYFAGLGRQWSWAHTPTSWDQSLPS